MTLALVFALVLAVLIGLALGLVGGGGAIVTLPVLVYVAGVTPQTAVGMSIAIVGATSLVGGCVQYLRGRIHPRATLLFAPTGIIGAYFGSGLTHLVPPTALMLIFACLMLLVGSAMLRNRPEQRGAGACRPLRCLALGTAVGVLTGFLGVGGGFLIVPMLVLFAGLDMTRAVGSSLAIIAVNSAAGLMGHLRYAALDWTVTGSFIAVAVVGMAAGFAVAGRFSEQRLRKLFATLVIVVAAAILAAQVPTLIR